MLLKRKEAGIEEQDAESDSTDLDHTDDNHPVEKADIDDQQPTEPASESLLESDVDPKHTDNNVADEEHPEIDDHQQTRPVSESTRESNTDEDAADEHTELESSGSEIVIDEDDDDDTIAWQLNHDEFSIAEALCDNHENSIQMQVNVVGQLTLCMCAILQRSRELRFRSEISDLSIYGWHLENALHMMELTDRMLSENIAVQLVLGQTTMDTERFNRRRLRYAKNWYRKELRNSSKDTVRLFEKTWKLCRDELIRHCGESPEDEWTDFNYSIYDHLFDMVERFPRDYSLSDHLSNSQPADASV